MLCCLCVCVCVENRYTDLSLRNNTDSCTTVHAYNTTSGEWHQLPHITPRHSASMTVVNHTQVMICGGWHDTYLSSCERLIDPANTINARWMTDVHNMVVPLYRHAVYYIDKMLMIVGGSNTRDHSQVQRYYTTVYWDVQVYCVCFDS
jgi:hypothetical protein